MRETDKLISPEQAELIFGELTTKRGAVTTYLDFAIEGGVWKPEFQTDFVGTVGMFGLLGYRFYETYEDD